MFYHAHTYLKTYLKLTEQYYTHGKNTKHGDCDNANDAREIWNAHTVLTTDFHDLTVNFQAVCENISLPYTKYLCIHNMWVVWSPARIRSQAGFTNAPDVFIITPIAIVRPLVILNCLQLVSCPFSSIHGCYWSVLRYLNAAIELGAILALKGVVREGALVLWLMLTYHFSQPNQPLNLV